MLIRLPPLYLYNTEYLSRSAWMHETYCITAFRFITVMNAKSKLRQFRFSKEIYSTLWWCTRIVSPCLCLCPYLYIYIDNIIFVYVFYRRASVWMNRRKKTKATRKWIELYENMENRSYLKLHKWNIFWRKVYDSEMCDVMYVYIYFTIFFLCM